MFCVNCGAKIDDSCKFCPYCGTAVSKPSVENEKIDDDDIAVEFSSNSDEEINNDNKINYAMPAEPSSNGEKKSRLAGGLLGIFLGSLGVHNFYLGYTVKAIIQLLLTILGGCCTFGLGAFASWVWGLVEGIMILAGSINTDGHGNELKD